MQSHKYKNVRSITINTITNSLANMEYTHWPVYIQKKTRKNLNILDSRTVP